MPRAVPVRLTDEQYAAAAADAARFGHSVEDRLLAWAGPSIEDAVRRWRDGVWERRRRTLEAHPDLAAKVDAQG